MVDSGAISPPCEHYLLIVAAHRHGLKVSFAECVLRPRYIIVFFMLLH